MQIKDSVVISLIDQISDHYKRNLNNRFLRPALIRMQLDSHSWEMIEGITEKSEYYQLQGFHPDELYDRILALAEFVYHARRDVAPNLRGLLSPASAGRGALQSTNERVLRDMSVNNFQSNLSVLADLVNKLYTTVIELDDKSAGGKTPVHKTIPKLKELGRFLVPR